MCHKSGHDLRPKETLRRNRRQVVPLSNVGCWISDIPDIVYIGCWISDSDISDAGYTETTLSSATTMCRHEAVRETRGQTGPDTTYTRIHFWFKCCSGSAVSCSIKNVPTRTAHYKIDHKLILQVVCLIKRRYGSQRDSPFSTATCEYQYRTPKCAYLMHEAGPKSVLMGGGLPVLYSTGIRTKIRFRCIMRYVLSSTGTSSCPVILQS